MQKIEQTFTRELYHILMTRTAFLLNKIEQKQVNDFECEAFCWHYEDSDNEPSFLVIFTDSGPVTILWNGMLLSSESEIQTDFGPLDLTAGNALNTFTSMEVKVMSFLIKQEKQMLADLQPKLEDFIPHVLEKIQSN